MLTSLALLVVIVIDQLRTDELFRVKLNPAGIGKLINQGVFYDDAHHTQFFNMTCPGHVAISTGAEPGLHGIMLNDDWDPKSEKPVYCVEDDTHHWIQAAADEKDQNLGTSAKRILTTTLGDEVKMLWPNESKIFAFGFKDRSAIALGGHLADGAYWFAPKSNVWTTSDAYLKSNTLPKWVSEFNEKKYAVAKSLGRSYASSTQSVEDVTALAEAAFDNENLGLHKKPDILWVSYSAHDVVGHSEGDASPALEKILEAEDKSIARLIGKIQNKLQKKKFLVVLTGDHGAGINQALYPAIPGGKMKEHQIEEKLNECLTKEGIQSHHRKAAVQLHSGHFYLANDIKDKQNAQQKTKYCLQTEFEGIWNAYTREEILSGAIPTTSWLKNLISSYYPSRGADVISVFKPYWNSHDDVVVSHETSYDYDSWVPLALWWPGVIKKTIHRRTQVTSLAPTLARLLKTRRPSGAMADYLTEVLDESK